MTEQTTVVSDVWVLDAMCLSHSARAGRLDVLRDLLVGKECWTTQVVLEEISREVAAYPALDEIRHFTVWADRLGSSERGLGEASVFAVAELRSGAEFPGYARQYGLL